MNVLISYDLSTSRHNAVSRKLKAKFDGKRVIKVLRTVWLVENVDGTLEEVKSSLLPDIFVPKDRLVIVEIVGITWNLMGKRALNTILKQFQ